MRTNGCAEYLHCTADTAHGTRARSLPLLGLFSLPPLTPDCARGAVTLTLREQMAANKTREKLK